MASITKSPTTTSSTSSSAMIIDPTAHPEIWTHIARFMDYGELHRLFDVEEQWKYGTNGSRRKRTRENPHPLAKLCGLNKRIMREHESNYIRTEIKRESTSKGNPIGRLRFLDDELVYRFRWENDTFESKEKFERVCACLEIDPNSEPVLSRCEGCFWFSADNKSCLWCNNDPRDREDYHPEHFEFTGLRSRVLAAKQRYCPHGWNLGSSIVWGGAPWNRREPEPDRIIRKMNRREPEPESSSEED